MVLTPNARDKIVDLGLNPILRNFYAEYPVPVTVTENTISKEKLHAYRLYEGSWSVVARTTKKNLERMSEELKNKGSKKYKKAKRKYENTFKFIDYLREK